MDNKIYYIAETEKGYIHRMFYGFYTKNFDDVHKVYNDVKTAKEIFDNKSEPNVPYKLLKVVERSERFINEIK